jgi:hypothetical protein
MEDRQLIETVRLLSAASAGILLDQDSDTQQFVVNSIAKTVAYWERNGCVLDPISREVVLDSLVATFLATAKTFLASDAEGCSTCRPTDTGGEVSPGVHVEEGVRGNSPAWRDPSGRRRLLVLLLQVARRGSRT